MSNLLIPIYLDTNILLDLIASIEGGFSTVEKVSTTNTSSEATNTNLRSLYAEINLPSFLKLGANPSKSKLQDEGAETVLETERYQTYGSLFNNLHSFLLAEEKIKLVDGTEETWANANFADFVQLRGIFRPNPFAAWIDTVNRLLKLAQTIYSEQDTKDKKSIKTPNPLLNQILSVEKILMSFREDIEQEGNRTFVIDLFSENQYKVVTNLFVDYLRDRSTAEISDKEFIIFGKCVRKTDVSGNETINLLSGTGLGGVGDSILNNLISSLATSFPSGNLPQIQTKIAAPAMQIIPIAVYV